MGWKGVGFSSRGMSIVTTYTTGATHFGHHRVLEGKGINTYIEEENNERSKASEQKREKVAGNFG